MEFLRINDYRNHKLNDTDVVKRVLAGEKELYEILLRRYNQVLFRVLCGYLNDEDEIQDTMQDTYLKAFEKLYQFKFKSAFSTWLIRIGINEALQKVNATKKLSFIRTEHLKNQSDENISTLPNPEKQMIQKESSRILELAIAQIDVKYRAVYIMKEVEGMRIRDIAEILGITESNVKVRVHRAKAMIKENLYKSSKKEELFEFGSHKCDHLVHTIMGII